MTASTRTSSIDFSHLETYVGGDRGIVREVLALFSEQARTVLPALNPAGPSGDWRNTAHSLKGSALGIGAFALAELCSEAEVARDEPVEVKRAILARIVDALAQALTDIAAYSR